MKSISELLENSAANNPNKTALIFDSTSYSYNEILKKSEMISNYLQERIDEKNVVSILSENSIDFIVAYFSILKSGLIAHIIPPNISDSNLVKQIKETESQLIFTSNKFKEKMKRTDLTDKSKFSLEDLSRNKDSKNDFFGNRFFDVSTIIFTSGTTSKPKGVKLLHKNVLTSTLNIVNRLELKNDNVEINSLSLSHSFGLGCLHSNFMTGGTSIIFFNTINLKDILEKSIKYSATGFVGVPNIFYRISDSFSKEFASITSLRYILTNTSPIKPKTVLKVIELLPNTKFFTYYGLTEASRSTFLHFNSNIKKIESVGKPPNNVEIKIIDEKDNLLSSNEIGEICIKGEHVIKEYWNNPIADSKIQDGWLKTGDTGYFDSDGFLFLKSRKDDLINVSGEKFSPEEVEEIINQFPGITESAVIGISNENFGQIPIAFVAKKGEINSNDIIKHCQNKVERYKIPTKIIFLDSIPKTESGKIKRNEVKANFI